MDIYQCEKCKKIFDEFEMNYKEAQKDKKELCRECRLKKEKADKRCRCYINFKYYAKQAKIGGAGMKNYKPCPVHDERVT